MINANCKRKINSIIPKGKNRAESAEFDINLYSIKNKICRTEIIPFIMNSLQLFAGTKLPPHFARAGWSAAAAELAVGQLR